jgi:hypothetical protein
MKHLITIVLILNTIGLVYLILRPNKAVTVDNSRYTSDTIVINTKPVITKQLVTERYIDSVVTIINNNKSDTITNNYYQIDTVKMKELKKLYRDNSGNVQINGFHIDRDGVYINFGCLGEIINDSVSIKIPIIKPKPPLLLHVGVSQEFGSISTLSPQLNVGLTKNKYTVQLGYKPFTKQYELGLQYTLDLRKK